MSDVPPYLTPGQVGKACRMTSRRAKRLLQRAGILEMLGGQWVVGESRLREGLPEVYTRVYEWFVLRVETDHN